MLRSFRSLYKINHYDMNNIEKILVYHGQKKVPNPALPVVNMITDNLTQIIVKQYVHHGYKVLEL